MVLQAKTELADLVVKAAGKVLDTAMDDKLQSQLASQTVEVLRKEKV